MYLPNADLSPGKLSFPQNTEEVSISMSHFSDGCLDFPVISFRDLRSIRRRAESASLFCGFQNWYPGLENLFLTYSSCGASSLNFSLVLTSVELVLKGDSNPDDDYV